MFWSKKKKVEKYSAESCLEMFDECNQDVKAREDNKLLYDKIKEYYLNKKELDVNIEWVGKGVNEKEIDKFSKRVLVDINPNISDQQK